MIRLFPESETAPKRGCAAATTLIVPDVPNLLEDRVKERTAQLKFQKTARKESEVQFKAVLSERTRLAQEAMTNVIKHSQATKAQIEIDYGPKNVVLRVSDNGRGFDRKLIDGPNGGHFGLLGISERAKR